MQRGMRFATACSQVRRFTYRLWSLWSRCLTGGLPSSVGFPAVHAFVQPTKKGHVQPPDPKTGIGRLILTAVIDAQTQQPEQLQQDMNSALEQIRNQVGNQKVNIDQFNTERTRIIDECVARRRANYARFFAAAEKLKLPIGIKTDVGLP